MTKLHGTVAALGVIAIVVAGCSGSSSTGYGSTSAAPATSSAAPAASGSTITISGMSFGDPITVSPGAQVSITNDDGVEHSVTSKTAGQFDTEVDAKEQKTFTAPTQPGEYPFYCKYHSNMKGTLVVK
jgi:plastocyanin